MKSPLYNTFVNMFHYLDINKQTEMKLHLFLIISYFNGIATVQDIIPKLNDHLRDIFLDILVFLLQRDVLVSI